MTEIQMRGKAANMLVILNGTQKTGNTVCVCVCVW